MIYLVFLIVLFIQTVFYDFLNNRGRDKFWWYLNLVFFIALAGFRWQVGGDTLTYQEAFETSSFTVGNFFSNNVFAIGWEPGFLFLMAICKSIINDFWFFQIVHATIVNIVIFRFIFRYSPFKFFGLLIYFFFNYLYFNTEVLRESLAICLFLIMFEYLKKGKYSKYYILNIVAVFFHYSSLALLFVPLLSKISFSFRNIALLIVLLSVSPVFFQLLIKVLSILPFADRVLSKIDIYLVYNLNINGTLYKLFCFVIFPLYLIRKVYKKELFSDIQIMVVPFLFFAMLYVMYSGFGRLLNYFIPFMMIFLNRYVYMLATFKRYRQVKAALILFLLIPPFYYKYSYYARSTDELYPNTTKFNVYYPYSSVFKKETFDFRKIIYEKGMSEAYNRALERSGQ